MICKHTQFKTIVLWEPRWHDKKALLAKKKVGDHNKILFTGKPTGDPNKDELALHDATPWYISGKDARKYKTESNGVIDVLAVPLSALTPLELKERCVHEL